MTSWVVYYIYLYFDKMNPTCTVSVIMWILHLFLLNYQVQPLCCICGTWGEKNLHWRQLSTHLWFWETLKFPGMTRQGSVIPKEVPFPAWDSGDAMWTDVDKLLLEEGLTKGLWLKGNTLLCPEHLHGLSVGAFLNPTCQHVSGREGCALHNGLTWDMACEEGWRKRALVNNLKYTSFFRV